MLLPIMLDTARQMDLTMFGMHSLRNSKYLIVTIRYIFLRLLNYDFTGIT